MLTAAQNSPWKSLLERPHSRGHFVQLYQSGESSLAENVGLYVAKGLKSGDGVIIIATPENCALFCAQVDGCGGDTKTSIATRQLVLFDAQQTLALFMVEGQPDWDLFEQTVGAAIQSVRPLKGNAGFRAYGEMVGLLWKSRQFAAAVRLEQFWNKLLARSSFSLYCAYAIDIFDKDFRAGNVEGVLSTHTHLMPAEASGNLDAALRLAMDDLLGPKALETRTLTRTDHDPSWAVMPDAEAIVLWLRKNLPEQAEQIIGRAREHYRRLTEQEATA